MNNINFSISKEFTRKPGLRYKWQSDFSGEEFRENFLINLFDKAVKENSILIVNLDDTFGYGPSFLEESFGGLARERKPALVLKHIDFISNEEPYLKDEILGYITKVMNERNIK